MARPKQTLVIEVGVFDELKTCCKCSQALPLSAFSSRPEAASGLRSACKSCCSNTDLSIVKKRPTEHEQALLNAFANWKRNICE